ncbi:hypothetical protein A2U01_0048936, partial [Trifolium medium]|nr:hypothetical protein [Trifolium medium]
RDYIERFTREAVEVKGEDDRLNYLIFEKGLRSETMFKEKLALKVPKIMSELLVRAHPYINYEEKLLANKVEKGK